MEFQVSCFNLAIEMLVISGPTINTTLRGMPLFQSRNRDACHFRAGGSSRETSRECSVSISQSRCLSFQGIDMLACGVQDIGFNLAIEMLVISGFNRLNGISGFLFRFNLAIEMLVISGSMSPINSKDASPCFNLAIEMLVISGRVAQHLRASHGYRFNLAIEMLVISGALTRLDRERAASFQSRNRDACHFRADAIRAEIQAAQFQSRNRDACHFRRPPLDVREGFGGVSISQSRCLSFQGGETEALNKSTLS